MALAKTSVAEAVRAQQAPIAVSTVQAWPARFPESNRGGAVDALARTPARQRADLAQRLLPWALASAALIVSEATQVSMQGLHYARTPDIHSREQVEGWRRDFPAAWHVGRISHPLLQPNNTLPGRTLGGSNALAGFRR